jgi:very-short-patch-repair endonuclease
LAEDAQRKVLEARPALASTLNIPVDDAPQNGDELAELRTHLDWVHDFRALLDRQEVGAKSAPPLTEEQVAALDGAHAPSAFQTAIDDWVARRDTVLNNFNEARHSELTDDLADYRAATEVLTEFIHDHDSAADWMALQDTLRDLRELGLSAPLDYAISTHVDAAQVSDYLMKSVYEAWFSTHLESDPRLGLSSAIDRDSLIERFRELDRELGDAAISTIVESATRRRPRSTAGQGGVILREAEKKRKHIPVRELIGRARDVIQSIHPCFMMSPLAVSQYLPPDIEFDVVIFDEASQVSPGDAINCIYRGKALITVGDQKQLPPTSFFTTTDDSDEDSDDENLAADYESILDLMKATGNFTSLTLRWHYRSRHEDLISYSNASFYDGRLVTFPGAISESDRYGVKFHKVEGIYRRSTGRDNPIEAKYVAQRVVHHFETRPDASLGVVAFSSAQRDTIENAISLARSERPDLDGYFQDDRVDGFFVKSLESVQGDERDVIIFSVGYGPDEMGKFYRQFGPVNRSGGQRRLNVAVTRARELVEIVSSVSSADIGEVTSEGARHLRRYLDFAERGPAALALELGPSGLGTESPFEDSVIDSIRSWGYDVQPQVGVAGYRIDIGVKHPNAPGSFMLGVECDGAMYHSSRAARDRDRLRHEILEGLGWHIHHIWGTAWYRNRAKEEQRLRELLEQFAQETVTTRVTKRGTRRLPAPVELVIEADDIDEIPDWVVGYSEASPDRIPTWLDLGEAGGHRHLIDLVRDVVAIEAPIHIDLVAQRLRDSSAIGRLGARIQRNLEAAISKADATFDGQFVRANSPGELAVRAPSALTERTVDQLPPEELSAAIIGVVRDARGISPEEATAHVAAIFGWRRRGSIIAGQLGSVVKGLCDDGRLVLTTGGLRVP